MASNLHHREHRVRRENLQANDSYSACLTASPAREGLQESDSSVLSVYSVVQGIQGYSLRIRVMILADDPRHDLARLDRHWLIDHAPLFRVVAHLHVAGERKVLAERMADEPVVGQNPPQNGV